MLFLSVFLLSAVSLCSGGGMKQMEELVDHINGWNWDVACWGEDNVAAHRKKMYEVCEMCSQEEQMDMTSLPAASLQMKRYKPLQKMAMQKMQTMQHGSYKPMYVQPYSWTHLSPIHHLGKRSSDPQEMLANFAEFKEDMTSKISNLTCVLANMGMLNKDTLQVNMDMFREGMWAEMDLSQSMAADPEWREKLVHCWETCHSIAMSIPQEALNEDPVMKVFGRQKIFMKCAMKAKKKMCLAGHAQKMLEKYHPHSEITIPGKDKYDMAKMAAMVMQHSKTPEMKFIEEFFQGSM